MYLCVFVCLFIIIIVIICVMLVWPLVGLVCSIDSGPSVVACLIFVSCFGLMRCLLRGVALGVLKCWQCDARTECVCCCHFTVACF